MLKRYSIVLLFLFGGWLLPGCGSGDSTDQVVVTITPKGGGPTLQSGLFMLPLRGNVTFKAEVTGSLNTGVKWEKFSGGGTLTSDNNKATYTAELNVFVGQTIMLRATSIENPEVSDIAIVRLTKFDEKPGKIITPNFDEIAVGGLPLPQNQTIDFNGDGTLDVVAKSQSSDEIIFYIAKGAGVLVSSIVSVTNPIAMVVGDFINTDDFVADVAVLSSTPSPGSSEVVFISGETSPPLDFIPVPNLQKLQITGIGTSTSLTRGKFHQDPQNSPTLSDLVVGTQDGEIRIYHQDRSPSRPPVSFLPAKTFTVSGGVSQLFTGNFDGDGLDDLVVVPEGSPDILIFFGVDMDGASTPIPTTIKLTPPVKSIVVSNLNRDPISDIIVSHKGTTGQDQISIFLGDGGKNFSNGGIIPLTFIPGKMTIRDLNFEGINDIAITNLTRDSIQIFFGDGTGQFIGGWESLSGASTPLFLISGTFSGFSGVQSGFQNSDLIYITQTPGFPQKLHLLNNRNF